METEKLLKQRIDNLEKEKNLIEKQYKSLKDKYDLEHSMLLELLDKYNNLRLEYDRVSAQIDLIQTNFLRTLTE
jgi:hypothetical protein